MPTSALPLGPLSFLPAQMVFPGEALLRIVLVLAVVVGGGFLLLKLLIGLGELVGGLFRGIARLVGHVLRTLGAIVQDSFRTFGSLATGALLLPLSVGSVALGRWSSAKHFARASRDEWRSAALSTYRVLISHPLKLVGIHALVEGFEQRLPAVLAEAPGRDRPRGGSKSFEGYEVVGSLPPGGSGALLYRARPTAKKREAYSAQGLRLPDEVVIKSFDLQAGSTLPQIVRENRALQAARSLGLVLEHELSPSRFHYVMPYVPGQDLGAVGRGLHAKAAPEGLSNAGLRAAMGYTAGLLEILERFHGAGLWHKDIKPSNVIVSGERVELVDLGLVTPLASALTLTTHGTEYYRDPEMVRLAMQGVKVHEVDGVKFDLYSVGAVLYGLIENSFPAHGSLSRIAKRCPRALEFVVQRAMADLKDRYQSASAMLADLRVLLAAADPFALRAVDLPSLSGAAAPAAGQPKRSGPPPLPGSAAPLAGATFAAHQSPKEAARALRAAQQASRPRRSGAGVLVLGLLGLLAFAGGAVALREARDRGHELVRVEHERAVSMHEALQARAMASSRIPDPQASFARAPVAIRPELPLLLLLRTPQALTSLEEQDLRAALTGVLERRVFSERASEQDRDGELAAEARRCVQLASLHDDAAFAALQGLVRQEADLGGVLWLETSPRGGELDCRYSFRRGSAFQSGRLASSRSALPQALLTAGLRPERSLAHTARGLALPRSAAAARSLAIDLEGVPPPAVDPLLREARRQALRRRAEAQLEAQAERHAEELEQWNEQFGESFEQWADDFEERIEDWRERFEERCGDFGETLESIAESAEEP